MKYPRMSAARQRVLTGPGHLYAAYSRYCDWVKIGFSTRFKERLDEIDHAYPLFAPFSLIGATPSVYRVEQQVHRFLEPLRQRRTASTKELYPAMPSIVGTVKKLLAYDQSEPFSLEQMRDLREWGRRMAQHPLNRIEAEICFERFRFERAPFATRRAA
jgi:hypothetical protein